MRSNRHDIWSTFCETRNHFLDRMEVPTAVARSESQFRDLLEAGQVVVKEARISLADLTPPQWAALYQFAAVFFREFESFAPEDLFPAFRHEAQQRGDKFPK